MRSLCRRLCLAAVVVVLCLGTALADTTPLAVFKGSNLHRIIARGKLVVGMELKFRPFAYVGDKGAPQGFDVDLAKTLGQRLGVKLEIRDMAWTGLIPALVAGKIDLIISGITGTLERAKSITFTSPYYTTGLCALLSVKKAQDVTRPDDLNAPGRVIAVRTGTTADIVAAKRFPKAAITRAPDETACVAAVVAGRADAFVYDQLSIATHHRRHPTTTRAMLVPFTYEPFCIALPKGDFDLWQWLEMFLTTIKHDGTLHALYDRHFGAIMRQAEPEGKPAPAGSAE